MLHVQSQIASCKAMYIGGFWNWILDIFSLLFSVESNYMSMIGYKFTLCQHHRSVKYLGRTSNIRWIHTITIDKTVWSDIHALHKRFRLKILHIPRVPDEIAKWRRRLLIFKEVDAIFKCYSVTNWQFFYRFCCQMSSEKMLYLWWKIYLFSR